MLDSKSLFTYVSKYGIGKAISNEDTVSFQTYLEECRRTVVNKTPKEYQNWETEKQTRFTENLIASFVQSNEKLVQGYHENGLLNVNKLTQALITSILDFDILTKALEDENIQEIQINDYKSIFVIRKGILEPYTDERGIPFTFPSNEDLKSLIYRMTFNSSGNSKRMTTEDPLLNTRATKSGYRISGVNDSAITPDKMPFDFPVTSFTIRKYNAKRLTFEDFVNGKSMTNDIARGLQIFAKADTKMFFVGKTGSGKTTLLSEALWCTDELEKIILIQNPTEILLYDRDSNGTNRRNSVHWEADNISNIENSDTKNTMSNLIAHALRNSPDIIVPGEARLPAEFYEMYRCLLFGQRITGTYHSGNGFEAIERFATEVATFTKSSKNDYISTICNSVDLIITQDKLEGGHRRVMEVSEPTGNILENNKPEINKLFTFELTGKSDKNEDGKVKLIHGNFIQKGVISDRLKMKIFKAGYNLEDIKFLTDETRIDKVLMEV